MTVDLTPGDRLWIAPPVGRPYGARVTDTTADRVRVRYDETLPSGETTTRTRWIPTTALEDWIAAGDLLINPERPARA